MKALQGDIVANRRTIDAERTREGRRKEIQQTLRKQNEAIGKRKRAPLQDRLYQAGMKIKARDWIRNLIILGVVISVICFVLQVPLLFVPVFGVAGAYLLGAFWLGRRKKKHIAAYLDELPNAVEAMVRGVKSGLPLNDSMRLVAKEAKEPIKTEFQRVLDQQQMGKSTQEAVQVLFDRMPLPEVNFFVVVITVQSQAGGNLSEALGNLARVLRNRKKMKQKIKAMSSEAKASAGIIGSLPFIVGILVTLTTPSYMQPLFTTTIGWIWVGIACVLMSIGGFMMNRMIQFDF
jgi:tight adherence protein B